MEENYEEADYYWCLQGLVEHMRHRDNVEVLRELLRVYDMVRLNESYKAHREAVKGLAEDSPF